MDQLPAGAANVQGTLFKEEGKHGEKREAQGVII
jgi:hypothetical protein